MALTTPTMAAAEARQHATFRALMWALSHPGRPQRLPVGGLAAFAAIGEALLDLETGCFTPHPELSARLSQTGARALAPDAAPYQFYPALSPADLDLIARAPIGSYRAPDTAATIVAGCRIASVAPLGEREDAPERGLVQITLRGPGVNPAALSPQPAPLGLQIAGLPAELWRLRAERGPYPLGWDLFLVDDDRVVGLPRTTQVEVR